MSTVQHVAMLSALNITGTREQEFLKYLKQYIGKGFCPIQREVLMLTMGPTKVYTGNISWTYKGKEREEKVEWAGHDLHSEVEMQLVRILVSCNTKPSNVKVVQAVVGGDHCDTIFQFGATITAELEKGECLHFEVYM
jgi:hypothetical protein